MADGAVKQGVPRQMALQFAAQTVLGAAKTVIQTEKHPAILRDEVKTTTKKLQIIFSAMPNNFNEIYNQFDRYAHRVDLQ